MTPLPTEIYPSQCGDFEESHPYPDSAIISARCRLVDRPCRWISDTRISVNMSQVVIDMLSRPYAPDQPNGHISLLRDSADVQIIDADTSFSPNRDCSSSTPLSFSRVSGLSKTGYEPKCFRRPSCMSRAAAFFCEDSGGSIRMAAWLGNLQHPIDLRRSHAVTKRSTGLR
jgi:hypothetical protein